MKDLGIIIPTINRKDLLLEALLPLLEQQIDIFEILIIDNGNQNIKVNDSFIKVIVNDHNIGVSSSWNFGINYFFKQTTVDYVMALNDDIVLGNTQIKDIKKILYNNQQKWFFTGPYYWSVWVLSREGANRMECESNKYFDEKFYPAYFEDNDFYYRMRLIDETKYLGHVSSFCPEVCRNSKSLEKDGNLNSNFEKNKEYYIKKWGGSPGCEIYKKAFNQI